MWMWILAAAVAGGGGRAAGAMWPGYSLHAATEQAARVVAALDT